MQGLIPAINLRSLNPGNIALNSDFELWPIGATAAPLGWTLGGAGAAVAQEAATINTGSYSAKVTNAVGVLASLSQRIDQERGIAYWNGKTICLSAFVGCASATRARIFINDGVTKVYSAYHTGSGNFEKMIISRAIANTSASITVGLEVDAGAAINVIIDTLQCNEGNKLFTFGEKRVIEEGVVFDYFPYSTIVGFNPAPSGSILVKRVGKICAVEYIIYGTSNAVNFTFTLPYNFTSVPVGAGICWKEVAIIADNGNFVTGQGIIIIPNGSNVATVYPSLTAIGGWNAWTAAGNKQARGYMVYLTD